MEGEGYACARVASAGFSEVSPCDQQTYQEILRGLQPSVRTFRPRPLARPSRAGWNAGGMTPPVCIVELSHDCAQQRLPRHDTPTASRDAVRPRRPVTALPNPPKCYIMRIVSAEPPRVS